MWKIRGSERMHPKLAEPRFGSLRKPSFAARASLPCHHSLAFDWPDRVLENAGSSARARKSM